MKQATFFYLPAPSETAKRWLTICNGDWNKAKTHMLKTVDRHRGAYWFRRHYCATYIWLLLNEPTPRLLGAVPTVTSLHSRIFSPSK